MRPHEVSAADTASPRPPASRTARLVLALVAGAAYFSPLALGIVPHMVLKLYGAFGFVLVASIIFISRRPAWINKMMVSLLATMLSVAFTDLALRPLTRRRIYYRADEMFIRTWPPIPILARYAPNVRYEGKCYGDLAAKSGDPKYREWRDVAFVTDRNGFRNRPEAPDQTNDVILLGDSFGVGTGTTQDKTLAGLLQGRHGCHVYNVSMTGNPYEELMSLKADASRFRTADHPVLLWLLFSGNDLFGNFGEQFDVVFQPWYRQAMTAFTTFRNRSPIREYLRRWAYARNPAASKENKVVVKDFPGGKQMLFYEPYLWLKDSKLEDITGAENYPKLAATFAAMQRFTKSKGWSVAVAIAPTKAEIYPWVTRGDPPWTAGEHASGFALAVEQLCASNGFACLDLQPYLVAAAQPLYEQSGALLWWFDDTHWNEHGQDVAASAIFDHLIRPTKDAQHGP